MSESGFSFRVNRRDSLGDGDGDGDSGSGETIVALPRYRCLRWSVLVVVVLVAGLHIMLGIVLRPHAHPAPPTQADIDSVWPFHYVQSGTRSRAGADCARFANNTRMIVAWEDSNEVRDTWRDSNGTWHSLRIAHVDSPEDAVLADLDGDGTLDAVSVSESGYVALHWSSSSTSGDVRRWRTSILEASRGGGYWMQVSVAQIDSQYGPDLVVGSKGRNGHVGWFQAPLDPRISSEWTWHPIVAVHWSMTVQLIDMNQDALLDIFVSHRGDGNDWRRPVSGLFWLERRAGAGAPEWAAHNISQMQHGGFNMATTFKYNGVRYALGAAREHPCLWLYDMSNVATSNSLCIRPQNGTVFAKSVGVADLDCDAVPDVVYNRSQHPKRAHVFWASLASCIAQLAQQQQQHTTSQTTECTPNWLPISGTEGIKFDELNFHDMDNDGDLDIVTCEERANLGVFWYENNSSMCQQ